jgi:ElaA protein
VLPPGQHRDAPAIGRVLTSPQARGAGLGRALMAEGVRRARELFPRQPIRLAAQQHLVPFYASLGFAPVGPPYDEDGIMHVDMLLPA